MLYPTEQQIPAQQRRLSQQHRSLGLTAQVVAPVGVDRATIDHEAWWIGRSLGRLIVSGVARIALALEAMPKVIRTAAIAAWWPTARPATPPDQPTTTPEPHAGASRRLQSLAILPLSRLNFLSRTLCRDWAV